ncbi:hypothetical protein X566_17610 [Afipia sp. P52-10]|nr:hypothetical protein X566_17610 [Afipia sp. P52-10]
MTSANGNVTTVVNGEIYNYPALRRELEAKGAVFQSRSDSEVVLQAYQDSGTTSFSTFNGMFAFGLWDDRVQKLFLVRDRLGIKPLYYWVDPSSNSFCFASEIKAILAAAGRDRWLIDAEGLAQYLTYQNLIGDRTLYDGIRMVPPGHYVEYDRNGIKISKYWEPIFSQKQCNDFSEEIERFRDLFSRSVERHLMSDVPIACYLSSGFDSSMVSATAAKLMPEPPIAFTGHFSEGAWYDESTGASDIATHLGIPVRKVPIDANDFAKHLDDVIIALDHPRMGMGAFSQFMVAKAAAEERKVILTGHGGDELFSGYPVFKLAMLLKNLRSKQLAGTLSSLKFHELPHLVYFSMRLISGVGSFLPVLFDKAEQSRILNQRASEAVKRTNPEKSLQTLLAPMRSDYERILTTYLQVYLPGLLVIEDNISMAHALEARTPFLDNEIVDYSLSLPEETKLQKGTLKAIIKGVARGTLPDRIFSMPKRGFPTPLPAWLRGPLAEWLKERLCGPNTRLNLIFSDAYLANVTSNYLGSWRKHIRILDEIPTHRIWMLLCLESWLRQTEKVHGVSISID